MNGHHAYFEKNLTLTTSGSLTPLMENKSPVGQNLTDHLSEAGLPGQDKPEPGVV